MTIRKGALDTRKLWRKAGQSVSAESRKAKGFGRYTISSFRIVTIIKKSRSQLGVTEGSYRSKNMREDILQNLQKEVFERCRKETNQFGMGCYYHISAVVKNAEILAEKYKADKEVVMIAAWLHDIASVTDYSLYEHHHVHGAEMAYGILKEYGYDSKKIHLVQECIRNHRGSVNSEKNSIEELCVADADAISHFDSVPSLLYLAYVQKGMGMEEGKEFVKDKLTRSFQKLSAESKMYYQDKFEKVMEVLDGTRR